MTKGGSLVLILAVGALCPQAALAAPRTFAERLLATHNVERARVGVPPLIWDDRLAQSAASYGPALAGLGRLQHSPKASRPGQRENLWMGSRGRFPPEQMVGRWIEERIWRSTTYVGCALHSAGPTDYLICRYSPPGNIDGRPVP
jgi:hypothetical protein